MKILMVAPEQLPVPGNGSVEICMLSIAKQFASNHHVTIVSRQSSGLPRVSRLGNMTIVRVSTGSPRKYISSVLHYIRGKQYDMIQVDNRPHYMAQVKKAFPKTPVSLFLHSLTFVPQTKSVEASMARANLIIANSHSLKSNLSRLFPSQAHKVRMVHLGVDVDRFKPVNRHGESGSFHVLFAGRVIPRKGVPVLIKAISIARKRRPDISLTIVGGGKPHYVGTLKLLAERYAVPARFTGKISHSKIHTMYKKAHCLVCPSQEHEAFGLVNVEAMATGLPVIASNIGGINEIVKHGSNGFLVHRYRNPEAHAKFILKVAQNKEMYVRLARQARKDAVSRFSWGQTASNLITIYNSAR
ncbi:glycosyltransferase family 4 protein [Paenibacillus sp. UNC451MF]|uniref:glycosyltransferase family 4 protein n=1 Tax=Paenibacillus sp. UNC451MF TaxID=1449063 RepID=UPI000562B5A8|nr:glycosyltransferase family 4 protein [Paenibacillus sp. UNC451MF]